MSHIDSFTPAQNYQMGVAAEGHRVVKALYTATGSRQELFKFPIPNESVVFTAEQWASLLSDIYQMPVGVQA